MSDEQQQATEAETPQQADQDRTRNANAGVLAGDVPPATTGDPGNPGDQQPQESGLAAEQADQSSAAAGSDDGSAGE